MTDAATARALPAASSAPSREALRAATLAFADAFKQALPPDAMADGFFAGSEYAMIQEHGPRWTYETRAAGMSNSTGGGGEQAELSSSGASERALLPYLGAWRGHRGTRSVRAYFSALAQTLAAVTGGLDAASVRVDTQARFVACAGTTVFKSVRTGQQWRERWAWHFTFAEERPEGSWPGDAQDAASLRIARWEIFADPLSAWLAVQGKLPVGADEALDDEIGGESSSIEA